MMTTFHSTEPAPDRCIFIFLCVVTLVLTLVKSDMSHAVEKKMTVGVEITAPCVMYQSGVYTGFDIELWEEIAKELNLEFYYKQTALKDIFTDLANGNTDIAFSCITVTSDREKIVDFSHHYMDSGLRIMVLDQTQFSLKESVKSFSSPQAYTTT